MNYLDDALLIVLFKYVEIMLNRESLAIIISIYFLLILIPIVLSYTFEINDLLLLTIL